MNKYEIMTALVKAGCDLNKLPEEVLIAIENCGNKTTTTVDEKSSESEYDRIVKLVDGKDFTTCAEFQVFLIDMMGFDKLSAFRYVHRSSGIMVGIDACDGKYVLRVK